MALFRWTTTTTRMRRRCRIRRSVVHTTNQHLRRMRMHLSSNHIHRFRCIRFRKPLNLEIQSPQCHKFIHLHLRTDTFHFWSGIFRSSLHFGLIGTHMPFFGHAASTAFVRAASFVIVVHGTTWTCKCSPVHWCACAWSTRGGGVS